MKLSTEHLWKIYIKNRISCRTVPRNPAVHLYRCNHREQLKRHNSEKHLQPAPGWLHNPQFRRHFANAKAEIFGFVQNWDIVRNSLIVAFIVPCNYIIKIKMTYLIIAF